MNPDPIVKTLWLFLLVSLLILPPSCKKEEEVYEPAVLSVDLPRLTKQNDLYYPIGFGQRSVELDFGQVLDTATIRGNVLLSESAPLPDSVYSLSFIGRKVFILFRSGFFLKEGWRYFITITPGLHSASGLYFPENVTLELRTTTSHPGMVTGNSPRNSVLCISDIHMGDPRALSLNYSWFSKNATALDSLLHMVLNGSRVRELVIVGDLFDEWVVPYRINPLDPQAGITNSREYFLAIANAPVNAGIISSMRAIASSGTVDLVYVPGNHDMLLTSEILQEIIPGIIWKGDCAGLGHYSPLPEIVMEHGHRYDFFNCPQPLSNPGHMLPPGYFISRLDAEGLMENGGGKLKEALEQTGNLEFLTAWTAAYLYLVIHYSLTVYPDSANIEMGGIDGYNSMMSFNGVMEMYAANIEDVWPATQTGNNMPVSMPVAMAILGGASDMSVTAAYEYMQPPAPELFRIVVFGHTHNAMISVYPTGSNYTGIYANTGTWVNAELTKHPVRTFVEILPGEWTDSDIDVVSLYQYNLDSGSGSSNPGYVPVLLAQESILNK